MRARLSALTGVLALILACLLAPAATAADSYEGYAITIMDKKGSINQGIMVYDETGSLSKSDCQASGDYQAYFSPKSSGSTCLIYKTYSSTSRPLGVTVTNKTSSSYDFKFKGYSYALKSIVEGKSGLDIKLVGTMLAVPKGSNVTADGAQTAGTASSDVYGWDTSTYTPEASGTVNFNGSSGGGGSNGGGGSSSDGDLGIGDLNGKSGGSGGSNNSTTSPAPSDSPTSDQKGATPAPSATSTAQTSSSSSSSSDDDDNTTLYIVAAVVAVIAVIGVIATVLVVKKNGKKNDQANFGPYPGAPGTGFGPNGPGFGGPAGPSGPGYGPNNFGGPAGPGAPAGGMAPGGPNYGGPNGPVGGPNGPVSGPNYGAPNGPAGGPNYGGPAPAGNSAPVAPSAPAAPSYPQGGYQGGPGAAQGGPAQNGATQGGYQSPSPSAPSAGYAAAPSAQSAAAGSPFAGQYAAASPAQPASPAQSAPSSSAGDDVVLPPQVTPAQPQDYDAAPAAGGDAEDYYPTIRLGQDEGLAPTRQYPSFNQNN